MCALLCQTASTFNCSCKSICVICNFSHKSWMCGDFQKCKKNFQTMFVFCWWLSTKKFVRTVGTNCTAWSVAVHFPNLFQCMCTRNQEPFLNHLSGFQSVFWTIICWPAVFSGMLNFHFFHLLFPTFCIAMQCAEISLSAFLSHWKLFAVFCLVCLPGKGFWTLICSCLFFLCHHWAFSFSVDAEWQSAQARKNQVKRQITEMGKFGHALALEMWTLQNSAGRAKCFAGSCAKMLSCLKVSLQCSKCV